MVGGASAGVPGRLLIQSVTTCDGVGINQIARQIAAS